MLAYLITNTASSKVYVGVTRRGLKDRWSDHREAFGNGKKGKLYAAMRKHGFKEFVITPVASARTVEDLFALEILLIAQYDSLNRGYNMTIGGDGPAGLTHTLESRAKMRQSHLGVPQPREVVEKRAASMRGRKIKPRSKQWAIERSKAMTGRKVNTPEHYQKLSQIFKGRVFTPEWKAKISAAKKGSNCWNEDHKRAHSAKLRGRKYPNRKRPAPPTHCLRGHEYTPENSAMQGPDKRWRTCRKCRKEKIKAVAKGNRSNGNQLSLMLE